jgi:hypothetical protein
MSTKAGPRITKIRLAHTEIPSNGRIFNMRVEREMAQLTLVDGIDSNDDGTMM